MHDSIPRFAAAALVAISTLSLTGCGNTGRKSGTQTGDEGEGNDTGGAPSTTTGSSQTSATSAGGVSTQAMATSATENAASTASSDGASTTGASGSSSGGATNGATTDTGMGGIAGGETGSDAPPTLGTNSGTTGGGAAGDECDPACDWGIECCNGSCADLSNDINNCGACGNTCEGDSPFCDGSSCGEPPCDGGSCGDGETCCGSECCSAGELCCVVVQNFAFMGCMEPVNGTCPMGCPGCDCAAPDTPIATPSGERPIASLRVGDLVYSVDEHGIVVVPILQVNEVPVENHHVMRVLLDDGSELRISPRHPLFGEGVFGDLRAGASLGQKVVVEVRPVTYELPATYDILPGSKSGAYFAAGALIGSTLAR